MSEDTIINKFGERFVKKFELKEYSQIVKEIEKLLLEQYLNEDYFKFNKSYIQ